MSNDFNASVVITTADAEAGIRNLDAAVGNLDKTLANLHTSLKTGQSDLDAVVASMKTLTAENANLIRAERERAKATTEAAKADQVAIVNQGKLADISNKALVTEAKVARMRSATGNSRMSTQATNARREAESQAKIADAAAITAARVATETERGAAAAARTGTALMQQSSAADRAASSSMRLADQQRRAANGTLELNDSLSNSRYLLYDVGQTYAVLSAALLAIPTATAAVAIAYEKDFAQVERTNASLNGEQFSELRGELKDLASEIPLTFRQFSEVATLGGQLDVASDKMGAFTETVARFGAASDVSLEESATAFARYSQGFKEAQEIPDFYNKIGSAVAFVGVKSAATESQIIAVSNQIAAAGSQFGFTAEQVVGLSGALASVRIRPELARGAFQRILLGLNRAADEGADSFQTFAKYTNLTTDAAMQMLKADPSQFFYKYIGGIKDAIAQTGSVSGVLDDIGAKNVFDKQFILGLANGYEVFGDALGNAKSAFADGSFLNESTDPIFNTMDAKLQRIGNSIKNLMDTIGKGGLPGLENVADTILNIVNAVDRFAQANPAFTQFLNLTMALGGAIGILLAFKAAQAFVLAGLVGFQQVLGKTSIAAGLTLKGNISELAKTMLMAKGATAQFATSMLAGKSAMQQMSVAASMTNARIAAMTTVSNNYDASTQAATASTGRMAGALGGVRNALAFVGGPIGIVITALGALTLGFISAQEEAKAAGDAIARGMATSAESGKRAIADALKERTVDSFNPLETAGGLGDHGKKVREIADAIGVSFEDIVNSIAKGESAGEDFNNVLNKLAENKGYKDWAEMSANAFDDNAARGKYLSHVVDELGDKFASSAKDEAAAASVVDKVTDSTGAAIDPTSELGKALAATGDDAEDAGDKLNEYMDALFGIVDAEAATQSALQGLGESLANSADVGTGTEGGRDNLKNFQDALRSAAMEQQQLIESTGKSTQQASADYIAFVEGLVAEMASRGVDPAQIQALADKAKTYFGSTLAEGPAPTVPVGVDEASAQEVAARLPQTLQEFIYSQKIPEIPVDAETTDAQSKTLRLVYWLADITGYPYEVVLDALTNPASEKSTEVYNLLTSITNGTYTAPVDADTSAAIANVQSFSNYARQELASIQAAYAFTASQVGSNPEGGFWKGSANVASGKMWDGSAAPTSASAAPKQVKAAPATAPKIGASPNFGNLSNGYDKVKDAAKKAGDAGKQAGKDMANGIDDASAAADDYANRLKTGLTAAYDQQHGLQKATDDYYSALNSINKKREDELKTIEELVDKQKELNDARNADLIDARKAGIEKNISLKYGEEDRAADYAQQEQEALNAAAAKQKDIQANNSQIISLRAGIGALDGYSQAAIDNRNALRELEAKMINMISAYAATGASQQQVADYAANLTRTFGIQVSQMGYNQGSVNALIGTTQRYIDTIYRVPYRVHTDSSNNFGAGAAQAGGLSGAINAIPTSVHTKVKVEGDTESFVRKWMQLYALRDNYLQNLPAVGPGGTSAGIPLPMYTGGQVPGFVGGGQIPGTPPSDPKRDNLMASVDGKGLVQVRSKEFIMSQPAVDYWGLDMMNSLNKMKMPRFNAGGSPGGGSSAGRGSGDPMLVELTADNLQAIMRLAARDILLFADAEKLASTVNEGQAILASKGVG